MKLAVALLALSVGALYDVPLLAAAPSLTPLVVISGLAVLGRALT